MNHQGCFVKNKAEKYPYNLHWVMPAEGGEQDCSLTPCQSLLFPFVAKEKPMIADQLKLCLVTHFTAETFPQYEDFILSVARNGITAVQLRIKNCSHSLILNYARQLKSLLSPLNIPLIINDHVDIAVAVDAAGVHIGQGDMTPARAREMLGANKIIGWSVENREQLKIANALTTIDYIGASAVFPSTTKLDCKTIWGLAGLNELATNSKHPVIAIGGINVDNVASVIAHGAHGVAVVSAIHQHPEPAVITRKLLDQINQARQYHV
jgi:thiamine-phosphate pyrophosphorylase